MHVEHVLLLLTLPSPRSIWLINFSFLLVQRKVPTMYADCMQPHPQLLPVSPSLPSPPNSASSVLCWYWEWNSGSHVCLASILLTEPSSQPSLGLLTSPQIQSSRSLLIMSFLVTMPMAVGCFWREWIPGNFNRRGKKWCRVPFGITPQEET